MTAVTAGGFLLPESPRWHNGALWFVDMLRGNVNRLEDGVVDRVASFDWPSSLGFRPNGDLLVADRNKGVLHTLREGELVESLDLSGLTPLLNDMAIDRHGRAYIGSSARDSGVGLWRSTGRIVLVTFDSAPRVVAENLLSPNGIAVSPDGGTLVLGESMGPGGQPTGARLLAFTISEDGSLSDERVIGTIARGSGDGLCFDSEGGVWVGTAFGHEVQRFVGGQVVERVSLADRKWALACALGGPEMKTLYICTAAPPSGGDPSKFTDGWIETAEVRVPGIRDL